MQNHTTHHQYILFNSEMHPWGGWIQIPSFFLPTESHGYTRGKVGGRAGKRTSDIKTWISPRGNNATIATQNYSNVQENVVKSVHDWYLLFWISTTPLLTNWIRRIDQSWVKPLFRWMVSNMFPTLHNGHFLWWWHLAKSVNRLIYAVYVMSCRKRKYSIWYYMPIVKIFSRTDW